MSEPIQPLEVAQEIDVFPHVQDASCLLGITAQDPWAKTPPQQSTLVLPYAYAKTLHEHLGQYLIRQQLYESEFRNQPK